MAGYSNRYLFYQSLCLFRVGFCFFCFTCSSLEFCDSKVSNLMVFVSLVLLLLKFHLISDNNLKWQSPLFYNNTLFRKMNISQINID
ncbi:hypothetical protein CW304_11725 [Bacillus sp. UFRGS-B20]|nr:hypothetical protein CW304_11725 [Bacillus sp. UFRGS-B20]